MRRLILAVAVMACLTVLCGEALSVQSLGNTHEILKGQEMRRLPAPCK